MHQPSPQDIVHTVIDEAGAYAFLPDEAAADIYAARVHGLRGPDMTRAAAERLVHGETSEPSRSQKMRDAGFTRRPSWRSLPSDE